MRNMLQSLKNRKRICLVLITVLFIGTAVCPTVFAKDEGSASVNVARRVAQDWIEAGIKQYERKMYLQAEQSFLRAQDLTEYLTVKDRKELANWLKKAHQASLNSAEEIVVTTSSVEKESDAHVRKIAEIYNKAVDLFDAGRLRESLDLFISIENEHVLPAPEGASAKDYIQRIQAALAVASETTHAAPSDEMEPVIVEDTVEIIEVTQPEVYVEKTPEMTHHRMAATTDEDLTYIEKVKQRISIIRSHTDAVVNDAIKKSNSHLKMNEFDAAREALASARRVVEENQIHLGEEYSRYTEILDHQIDSLNIAERAYEKELASQRQAEAIESQKQYRENMAKERAKRIDELLQNARTYQKQQRYEEALGQLELVLALDPLNDPALSAKVLLEDMIVYRKQLALDKEATKERAKLLMEQDRSGIPYSDEINYPKNWREIDAKRSPRKAVGEDPLSKKVNDQLKMIVDLSSLSPDMPLDDAIETLRYSVEPPVMIVPQWTDLEENATIYRTDQIGMPAISGVPLGTALKLLLESVSGGISEIGYTVDNGIVKIATEETLKERQNLETRIYDISDLLSQPADFYSSSGGGRSGGGRGGSRGGRGGGGGSGSQSFDEYFDDEGDDMTAEDRRQSSLERATQIVQLISTTIEPESWWEAGLGGDGTINIYELKKLVVYQTSEVHDQIEKRLNDLREGLGYQVAIEARFLVVGEHFLRDIGFDVDFSWNPGGSWTTIGVNQRSADGTSNNLTDTGVPGTLAGLPSSVNVGGGWGTLGLNDLQVDFIIRATQAHKDTRSLVAPKLTVISGETATFRQQRTIRYALVPDVTTRDFAGGVGGTSSRSNIQQNYGEVLSGSILNITPTITRDKKHVLLNITTELRKFLGFDTSEVQIPDIEGLRTEPLTYSVTLPQTEISRVRTRVTVPDGGTLLLGGQKVSEEVNVEQGVPILSKIPLLGRLFDNRSKIKDNKILLVLVKPTIILQEETDAEALGTVHDNGY